MSELLHVLHSAEYPDSDLVNLSDSRNENVDLEDLSDVSPKILEINKLINFGYPI